MATSASEIASTGSIGDSRENKRHTPLASYARRIPVTLLQYLVDYS